MSDLKFLVRNSTEDADFEISANEDLNEVCIRIKTKDKSAMTAEEIGGHAMEIGLKLNPNLSITFEEPESVKYH